MGENIKVDVLLLYKQLALIDRESERLDSQVSSLPPADGARSALRADRDLLEGLAEFLSALAGELSSLPEGGRVVCYRGKDGGI